MIAGMSWVEELPPLEQCALAVLAIQEEKTNIVALAERIQDAAVEIVDRPVSLQQSLLALRELERRGFIVEAV